MTLTSDEETQEWTGEEDLALFFPKKKDDNKVDVRGFSQRQDPRRRDLKNHHVWRQ